MSQQVAEFRWENDGWGGLARLFLHVLSLEFAALLLDALMMSFRIVAGTALLALTFGTACGDDGPTGAGGDGVTRLNVQLTDAPGDVEAVWVELVRVYLQGGDGPVDLLAEPTELIEITELVGTSVLLVEDLEVASGSYGQLRFVIGDAVLEASDGTVYVLGDAQHPDGLVATGGLQCPSCQQSGIKVVLPGGELDLEEGDVTITLDFDVSETFGHKAGNSGRWVMRPKMHGTWLAGEPVFGPAARGLVRLADGVEVPACPAGTPRGLSDFVPLATATTLLDGDGLPLLRTGTTGVDGSFIIGPLAPDSYDLGYLGTLELEGADLNFEASVSPQQVAVTETDAIGVVYDVTSATCDPVGG